MLLVVVCVPRKRVGLSKVMVPDVVDGLCPPHFISYVRTDPAHLLLCLQSCAPRADWMVKPLDGSFASCGVIHCVPVFSWAAAPAGMPGTPLICTLTVVLHKLGWGVCACADGDNRALDVRRPNIAKEEPQRISYLQAKSDLQSGIMANEQQAARHEPLAA
jgi:hypothetical protein